MLALGIALWALVIEPRRLVTNRVDLDIPRWPPEHAGLKVALLSDLHVGSPHWGVERTRELVARTNAERGYHWIPFMRLERCRSTFTPSAPISSPEGCSSGFVVGRAVRFCMCRRMPVKN